MDNFWKSICEIKLMPLTTFTGYSWRHKNLMDKSKYMEPPCDYLQKSQLPKHAEVENLCLRLTQNFQLVSPNGTLDIDNGKSSTRPLFSMCFRDRYAFVLDCGDQLQVQTFQKMK